MNRLYYEALNEEIYWADLPSGLRVHVIPKPGFVKKYATLSVRCGSNDLTFVPPDSSEPVELPEGIAHFLEHKMFEKAEGNTFEKYARLGASPNAYTNYTQTSYLFATTERFEECFELLLDSVQEPYFTDQTVEKEKGIIEQEIRMYDDSAQWKVHSNLMLALFHRHPVRRDIAGTVESIRRITADMLYRCHRTFYRPDNMTIFVVGDVDPASVIQQAAENLERHAVAPAGPIQRLYPEEPPGVYRKEISHQLAVAMPLFSLGIKDPDQQATGQELVTRTLASNIILDLFLGRASELWARLYDNGLIDETFSLGYTGETDFCYASVSGETRQPERVRDEIIEAMHNFRCQALREEDFNRIRNKVVGSFMFGLNSLDWIANLSAASYFRGVSFFDQFELARELSLDQVSDRLAVLLNPQNCALSVVYPRESH